MASSRLPFGFFLLLLACGRDPILDRADELGPQAGAGQPGGGNGGGNGGGDGGGPAPGRAVDPSPAVPRPPEPGSAVQPPPGTPTEPAPGSPGGQADGPQVVLKGEIALPDYELGQVRIDIFDGDQRELEGPRPSVVGVATMERPGAFEVSVPASAARVWLGAYVDEDLDGRPSPQDPAGWYAGNPVETAGGADGAVDGIVIVLERQPPPPQHGL